MLGNGVCESACNTPRCGFDGGDCYCAKSCSPINYGTCTGDCVTPACDFDGFERGGCSDQFLVTLNLYSAIVTGNPSHAFDHSECLKVATCQLSDLQHAFDSQQCVSACNKAECLWSMGYCSPVKPPHCSTSFDADVGHCFKCEEGFVQVLGYCVESCPRGFETLEVMPQLCRERLQDETETDEIYVFEDPSKSDGDGSFSSPYPSLAVGVAAAWQKRTVINVLGKSASFVTDFEHKEFLWHANVKNLLKDSRYQDLTIKSLTCEDADHENCSPTPCTVTWDAGFTLAVRAKTLTVLNINFNSTCTLDQACRPLASTDLFVAGASSFLMFTVILIQSVNFTHIRVKSVIIITFATLHLTNVSFVNVTICNYSGCGVIIQDASCTSWEYCGSLTYTGGTVSLINNFSGPDYITNRFLVVALTSVHIVGVAFTYNHVSISLIGITAGRSTLISDCKFENNYCESLLDIRALSGIPKTADKNNVALFFLQTHIQFHNVQFKNNFAHVTLIFLVIRKDILNIAISGCEFADNDLRYYVIMMYTYSSLRFERLYGNSMPITNAYTGVTKSVFIPKSFFNITDTIVTGHTSFQNLFNLNLLDNINFHNLRLIGNVNLGGKNFTEVAQRFLGYPGVGGSNLGPIYNENSCTYLISVGGAIHVEIDGFVQADNVCMAGSSGLRMNLKGGVNTVESYYASNNTSGTSGSALFFDGNAQVIVSNFTAVGNSAQEKGTVYVDGTDVDFTLKDSVIKGNSGNDGAGIWVGRIRLLKVQSTLFQENTSQRERGGAIAIFGHLGSILKVEISNTTFTGNQGAKGAAIFISSIEDRSLMSVIVSGSFFSGNSAEYSGASIYLEKGVILSEPSTISHCQFTGELNAAVALFHDSGNLTFSDSLFSQNSGQTCSCFLVQTSATAETFIQEVRFDSNKQGPVIMKTNISIYSQLWTLRCLFIKNSFSSVVMEGGKWIDADSVLDSTHNTAVSLLRGTAALSRTSFRNNSALINGGGLHVYSNSVLNCTDCIFEENNAESSGGAVFVELSSIASFIGCRFEHNRAKAAGSAIFVQTASELITSIANSQFLNNEAGMTGTISLEGAGLSLTSTIFDNNKATSSPGISAVLASLTVADSEFRNQEATDSPFLSLFASSSALIQRTLFENSRGPIGCIEVDSSKLIVEDTLFRNVTVITFGAIVIAGSSEMHFVNSTVRGVAGNVITVEGIDTLSILGCVFSEYSLGAVVGQSVKSVSILGSKFVNGSGKYGSAICCYDCEEATIANSVIERQTSTSGAVYFRWTRFTDVGGSLTVLNTEWKNNAAAVDSGGMFVLGYDMTMKECSFNNNSALSSDSTAGALHLVCENLSFCNYTIIDTRFSSNHANKAGGAIYWEDFQPLLSNNTYFNNSARYGPNIASFPASLNLNISYSTELHKDVENAIIEAPGQNVRARITVSIVDHYGMVVNIENSSIGQLVSLTSGASISDRTEATAVNGQLTYDSFLIYASQSSLVNLSISIAALKLDSSPVRFYMRECIPGEYTVADSCVTCAERTYSFDPSVPCQQCLAHTQCLGNYTVLPDSGYWRPGMYSEQVFACLLKSACKGGLKEDGSVSYEGVCAEGYKGNLCQSCDIGYSRTAENLCGKCPSQDVNIVRIIFVTVGVLLVNAVLLMSSLKSALQPKALYSIYFKIMANYWQLVFLVTEFKLKWPDPILNLFNAQQRVGGAVEQMYSIDCFLSESGDPSDIFYQKMIYISLLPLVVIGVSVLYWVLAAVVKHKRIYLTRELLATVVIAFFIIHPTLMKSLFSLYSCSEIKRGEYWLATDMAIRCGNREHVFYSLIVGLPAILVWVLGVPLACLAVLVKHSRQLSEVWIRMQYGFLISGYRSSCFYWEFLILARKLVVICCFVFITNSTRIQALVLQVVLLAALFLQYQINPYSTLELNHLELLAILATDVTIYSGLFYLSEDLTEGGKWFFFFVIVLANAAFLVQWGLAVLKELAEKVARAIPSIGSRLCPSLFEQDPYIEDFVASADRTRDYSQYQLSDLKSMYVCMRGRAQNRATSSTSLRDIQNSDAQLLHVNSLQEG